MSELAALMENFPPERWARVVVHAWTRLEYPYGLVYWSDWEWVDLPSPSSQMWPGSRARRA